MLNRESFVITQYFRFTLPTRSTRTTLIAILGLNELLAIGRMETRRSFIHINTQVNGERRRRRVSRRHHRYEFSL